MFVSDTDTEVIPKLCLYLHRQFNGDITLPKLAMEVMVRLEGAFALLIKSAAFYPGQLLACKRGSPLVFVTRWSPMTGDAAAGDAAVEELDTLAAKDQAGTAPGVTEVWLASDAAALLKHSRAMTVLDDEDLLHVDAAGKLTMYNLLAVTKQYKNVTAMLEGLGRTCASQLSVTRRARRVSMELEAVMKVRGLGSHILWGVWKTPGTAGVANYSGLYFTPGTARLGSIAISVPSLTGRICVWQPGSTAVVANRWQLTPFSCLAADINCHISTDWPRLLPPPPSLM